MGHMGKISGHHRRHDHPQGRARSAFFVLTTIVVALALVGCVWLFGGRAWLQHEQQAMDVSAHSVAKDLERIAVPETKDSHGKKTTVTVETTPKSLAKQMVDSMSVEDQCAQLIMAPLDANSDPSSLKSLIDTTHIGSVLVTGNWTGGIAAVRKATSALEAYSDKEKNLPLFIATDQEGGQVQHLSGVGFSTIPSAYDQGRMSTAELESSAQQWGQQLNTAGINIDLAPSVDTVLIDRATNAPIGELHRDFGLNAMGNAEHAIAFMKGMTAADVGSTVKHFPGLGAVTGNTDFTEHGTVDTITSSNSLSVQAFTKAIADGNPAMVMISLAVYENLDPDHPAAFSSYIIGTMLRQQDHYDGVVISDSLSASAVQGYETSMLGVLFVQAGGDIVCISDPAMTQPILDGMIARAQSDPQFAAQVKTSATRVLTQKYEMNLNEKD